MPKKIHFPIAYLFIGSLLILLVHDIWQQRDEVETISYSEYQKLVKENRIAELTVSQTQMFGTLKSSDPKPKKKFVTMRVDPTLSTDFLGTETKVYGMVEHSFLADLASWVLPALIFFGIWMLLVRRLGGRGGLGGEFMAIGKSKAKVYVQTDTQVTFRDVAGVDEAKIELQEIVNFLKNPEEYGRLGGRMPKGVLLVGPPGTGKTLLAKAVAGEASVPFFSISGSEFVEMFVGVGAARVRDLFEQARLKAPAIIFIDELDALGRSRAAGPLSGGHDEKEQTLNQLLVELDGFDSKSGLVLLAATNRPEILDPALLRAGRFDRQVLVDRPDKAGRIAILNVHMKHILHLHPSIDADQIASLTPGFTGADLANLVNEAALIATRRGASSVEMPDFTEAMERIVAGLEKKNRLLNPLERKVVAYHEMGHVLVSLLLSTTDRVHKVSIIPRGIAALGYTIQRPTEDRFLMTKQELENKIAVLLAGRAAEHLVFDHWSTGAADDLSKATDIAWSMVSRYGMEVHLGHVAYEREQVQGFDFVDQHLSKLRYGAETAQMIDRAVKGILDVAFDRALVLLKNARKVLEESAELLLTKETLNEQELEVFLAKLK